MLAPESPTAEHTTTYVLPEISEWTLLAPEVWTRAMSMSAVPRSVIRADSYRAVVLWQNTM